LTKPEKLFSDILLLVFEKRKKRKRESFFGKFQERKKLNLQSKLKRKLSNNNKKVVKFNSVKRTFQISLSKCQINE